MAKEDHKTSISFEDFQKFLEVYGKEQLEAIKELKKPYVSEQEIEAKRRAKEQFRMSEQQAREHKKWKEDHCTHIRPQDQKSLFWQFRNVYPKGAVSLLCCRCNKLIQNFDPEGGKIINNPEFEYWVIQPNGLFQG